MFASKLHGNLKTVKCHPRRVQLLYLHNTLPVTNDQRLQIMNRCAVWFQKAVPSQQSGRMYDMLSYFIGPKHTTGMSLVDGVDVQAFCIFNQDHEPVKTDTYPADVYNGVSVDMTAARRHGFSVVACRGVSDTQLQRHPVRTPNGYNTLEASALKSQGCYIIPMVLKYGARHSQKSSHTIPDLLINYPYHITVFKDLLPAKQ
ncbi:uncharacterized protein LOC135823313 isoform X3 [Sycon ciliatum]|uniref:uncharacterized protein LOC135823313 isoform X2 n=1 Tax=Sycon ciliatum TaxID=27933 RepID=UPI0031F674B8